MQTVMNKAITSRLRAGDWVQVRTKEEILSTLDADGRLDELPFMPEMLPYCGRKMRVGKRAHKTCDPAIGIGGRKMENTVHLENIRCNGSAHDGCEAACLIFWKEAWLKPVRDGARPAESQPETSHSPHALPEEWSVRVSPGSNLDQVRYRCQITEISNFTTQLFWWDIRQYIEDITSGNVGLGQFLRGVRFSIFRAIVSSGHGFRMVRATYNWFQRLRGGSSFPFVTGPLKKTPHQELHLKPGEWIRVKSFDEIVATDFPGQCLKLVPHARFHRTGAVAKLHAEIRLAAGGVANFLFVNEENPGDGWIGFEVLNEQFFHS